MLQLAPIWFEYCGLFDHAPFAGNLPTLMPHSLIDNRKCGAAVGEQESNAVSVRSTTKSD